MRTIQVIILLIASWCLLQAQEVEFTATVSPDVLRVGEQFNLIYTANQELEELNLPEISDFELLAGPSQGHSRSVSNINGKITTVSTWQYTYFLRASKEGKFTIPAASVKIKGKIYKSNAANVEVIKSAGQTTPASSGTATNAKKAQGAGYDEKDLFVRLVLDKREAYVGEQIMASVKIYTKTNLSGIDQNFKGPDFTGFFTEPVETPPLRNLQREAVDGDIYYTGVIRRMVIIPQKTGELTIRPFDLDVAIRREIRRRVSDPFFDDFVMPDIQDVPVSLKSNPVKISVRELPSGAPASFKGAVGNFKMNAYLNKTTTVTNDPLTLKIAVSGRGNLKLINEVAVKIPYDMEQYDPVINTHMDNPLSGSKTFEYMIMPRHEGSYDLEPAEFTYFDPDSRKFITLKSQSFHVEVAKGQNDTLMVIGSGVSKEDVKMLNQDIRFIKTKSFKLSPVGQYIARSPWYYLFYLLLLALFITIYLLREKMIRQHADVAGMRLRKADKYARKRLRKSEALLKQGKDAAFFEELSGAIWGYLSDKLKLPMASLSKDTVRSLLIDRAVDEETIGRLFSIIDTCEMARYSGITANYEKNSLYREALTLITLLHQKLKKV